MEELTIRITLTNAKGWKETKSLSFNRYVESMEDDVDLVEQYIHTLKDEYENYKNNSETNKKFTKEWRP